METRVDLGEGISFSPAETQLTPERENERKALIAHEAAHAVVAYRLKLTLDEIVLNDDGSGHVQQVVFKGSRRDFALFYTAGFVGEFLAMGKDYLKNRRFRNMSGDREVLKNRGYTKEEVDDCAMECLSMLKNDKGFKELCEVLSLRWKRGEKDFVMGGREIEKVILLGDRGHE